MSKVDRPAEFTVDLDLTGEKGLGLEVDWADGKTLFIKSVKAEGAVPSWNLAHQELPILAKDRVLSINGTSGDPKAMLAVCKKQKKLALLVRNGSGASNITSAVQTAVAEQGKAAKSAPKFFEFNVTVDMSFHTQLGLDVDWANGKSLYVRHLQGSGAVEEWNRQHPAHLAVHAGDRIVAVNGFSEDAQGMLSLCRDLVQSRSSFLLRVRGPPPPPPENKDSREKDKKESDSDGEKGKEKVKEKDKKKDKEKSKKEKEKEKKDKEKSKRDKKEKDKDEKDKSRKKARSSSS